MSKWLRRLRGAIGIGLVWAVGGFCVGAAIELLDNVAPGAHGFTRLVDMWPQTLAILAFRRGVLFAVVLGVARGHRRFEQFSLRQFAGWGAVAGLVLGAIGVVGGASLGFLVGSTLLSALAGAGSLALARAAEGRGLIGGGAGEPRLTGATPGLLGRPD